MEIIAKFKLYINSSKIIVCFLYTQESTSNVPLFIHTSRLAKSCEEIQFHERERTKRIVYSVIYGVGTKHPVFD